MSLVSKFQDTESDGNIMLIKWLLIEVYWKTVYYYI